MTKFLDINGFSRHVGLVKRYVKRQLATSGIKDSDIINLFPAAPTESNEENNNGAGSLTDSMDLYLYRKGLFDPNAGALAAITELPEECINELTNLVIPESANFSFLGGFLLHDLNGVEATWNTTNMTSAVGLFYACFNLEALNLVDWNTRNLVNQCGYLPEELLNATSNTQTRDAMASQLFGMFTGCGFYTLDLHNWDTSNIRDFSCMFAQCARLEALDISSFTTDGSWDGHSSPEGYDWEPNLWMFSGCNNLKFLIINNYEGNTFEPFIGPSEAMVDPYEYGGGQPVDRSGFERIGLNHTCKILVPAEQLEYYKTESIWADDYADQFESIEDYEISYDQNSVGQIASIMYNDVEQLDCVANGYAPIPNPGTELVNPTGPLPLP